MSLKVGHYVAMIVVLIVGFYLGRKTHILAGAPVVG